MALDALEVEFSVVLGRAAIPLNRLLRMGRGALIALDPTPEDRVEILANGLPVAHGRVLVEKGVVRVEVTELIRAPEFDRQVGVSIGGMRGEPARANATA